jgi:hypothetical protein
MSVNYRSCRLRPRVPAAGGSRRAGQQRIGDVIAAGKWLAARPDVDPNRVGIGPLHATAAPAQALARNSDVFKAGVISRACTSRATLLDRSVSSDPRFPDRQVIASAPVQATTTAT